jgi:hypothetical protein
MSAAIFYSPLARWWAFVFYAMALWEGLHG